MADEDEDDDAGGAKGGGPEEEDDEEASSVSGGLSLMHLELSEEDQPAVVPYEEVRLSPLGGAVCSLWSMVWCGRRGQGTGRGAVCAGVDKLQDLSQPRGNVYCHCG